MKRIPLLLCFWLLACGAPRADLTVSLGPPPADTARLRVVVRTGTSRLATDMKPDTREAVYHLPTDAAGPVEVTADALLADGTLIGTGRAAAQASGTSPLRLDLPVPAVTCSASRWCWENPLPQGNNLLGLWGTPNNDLWAVGLSGTILRGGATPWRLVRSGTTQALIAVWGTGASDVWAVGTGGAILRWNGAQWAQSSQGNLRTLVAVHGTGPQDVWVAGDGVIGHWDGRYWVFDTSLPGGGPFMRGIFATGPSDVWAVGDKGTILRYNGAAWTAQTSPTTNSLSAIWGASADDLWAVGSRGTVLHRVGGTWTAVAGFDTAVSLTSVWGTSAGDVWVRSAGGGVWLRSGAAWLPLSTGRSLVSAELGALWGSGPFNLWVVDGAQIQRWDGTRWATTTGGTAQPILNDIWGSGRDDVWAVGNAILHRTAAGWAEVTGVATQPLTAVWGSGPRDVWTVGLKGTVLRWDGATWRSVSDGSWKQTDWYGVWGSGPGDVWLLGGSTNYHWDGSAWSLVNRTLGPMFGFSAKDIWAIAAPGTLQRYDGSKWIDVPSGTPEQLISLWGCAPNDVWAVGVKGAVAHWTGQAWKAVASGTGQDLRRVWGSGCDSVYAAGGSGIDETSLLRWNGTAWLAESSGVATPLVSGWSIGADDIWAVGYAAILRRYPSR